MTHYNHELVIVCPLSRADDFQHLSSTWFENLHIGGYDEANMYYGSTPVIVKGTVTTEEIKGKIPQEPTRHPNDDDENIDMGKAQSAKAQLVVVTPDDLGEEGEFPNLPNPRSSKTLVFVDIPLSRVISELGMTRTDPEDET